ncbi:CheR family methyltransferase [Heyndrickxia acidicola]|uniref:protein-glutamate O-methyltransferase n=1 Tax=Heyndrickxia acidicola TaxID=209389 RepID=A0ABU6MLZ5_9BACI|nr:protein-glutamate O-methyltransferase CheR [Heyndrickxia acidicola]MED1204996.1 protein-glutamate O-methyltransferase CheR [Heyndrickxia acidicola]
MDQDYQQFSVQVLKKTGIDLSLYKEGQMKRRLATLYEKRGFDSFQEYFKEMNSSTLLLNEFLDRITINVTEFFRNAQRWSVLENKILPRLIAENKPLKIWSAASSTGEEPYTLAMILSNYLPGSQFSILATDIDNLAIQRAREGVYQERSLSEVPVGMKKKYFQQDGSLYRISPEIKRLVTFKQHNLLAEPFDYPFDLIICRNVLIYFTEEAKTLLYRKFSESLRPGGSLFVGSTEQIFTPREYNLEIEDTFFYKRLC